MMVSEDVAAIAEFAEEEDAAVEASEIPSYSDVVVSGTDWTVETVLSQLRRGNIDINPKFQRRDAWTRAQKGRFIESLLLGLPIPQIVLAEKRGSRGQFVVLDGKQRLLTVLQFTGQAAESPNNSFGLSGLDARSDLLRKKYTDFETDPLLCGDLTAFLNHTIRAVTIRNWPSLSFLHLVFLRLNTGSVKLSPQELRQAMFPGEFSSFVDDAAGQSASLQALLGRSAPDPRMRDVELLVRYLAFRFFINDYAGRMKSFLDDACQRFHDGWAANRNEIEAEASNFDSALSLLFHVFGTDRIARKPDSRPFNRAIFDALMFYAADDRIRQAMLSNAAHVQWGYNELFSKNARFRAAIESDTAGVPNTYARLQEWGKNLQVLLEMDFNLPVLEGGKIIHHGFWNSSSQEK